MLNLAHLEARRRGWPVDEPPAVSTMIAWAGYYDPEDHGQVVCTFVYGKNAKYLVAANRRGFRIRKERIGVLE